MKKLNEILKLITSVILLVIFLIFAFQLKSQAENGGEINFDDTTSTARKTEIITNFDWKTDVNNSIGTISIEDEGRRVQMTGNETLPGKNAIYIIPENHQEQNLTFDYVVDYGDSFNAAGVLLKIKEENGMLLGYMLSFNNPGAGDSSAWYGQAQNQLGAIWTIRYKLNDNSNNVIDKTLVKAIDLPVSGRISVKATQDQIILTGDSINETIDTTGNSETGDGFGFFTDHYSHGCDQIGNFALTNFGLQTVDLIPHNFIVDPNGGVWNNSSDISEIVGIYQDTVQVPLPTRDGYTFVKWTQIGDSGTMSSLTDDAVYTFGENEEIDDRIVAEWIRIVGDKTCNIDEGKVKLNDIITYTVTLRNEGTVDGKAIIKDDAPDGTQFVENSIKVNDAETQYTLEDLNNGITVDVPQGGETSLTFDVQVNDLNDEDLVTNTANYEDITVQGKETSSETNQVDLTYVEPIISVEKDATTENGNDYVTTDETIEYQITVQNAGGLAKDITIKDIIPEGTTFVDGSIKINGQDTDYTAEDLENGINTNVPEKIEREDTSATNILGIVRLMRMNALSTDSLPGETILTFEVTVDNQKDENQITNVAQVDDTSTNEVDYTYRKPIISAQKEMKTENDLDYVVSGENVEYSIVIENEGSIEKDVLVQDLIPDGTTFVDGSIKVDGEDTDYTDDDLSEGIQLTVPEKHIKDDENNNTEQNGENDSTEEPDGNTNTEQNGENETTEDKEENPTEEPDDNTNLEENTGNIDETEEPDSEATEDGNTVAEQANVESSQKIDNTVSTMGTEFLFTVEAGDSETTDSNTTDSNTIDSNTINENQTVDDEANVDDSENETTDENVDGNTTSNEVSDDSTSEPEEDTNEDLENPNKEEHEDSNLQENEEPGQIVLTFEVTVDELTKDTETKTIKNIAQVDSKDTNETSIEALPFNMKIDEEISGFNVNGSTQTTKDPKLAKTDIDMRKSSPTPQVTANIKITVTNTSKIAGSAEIEATIPEGFTLSNTTNTKWESKGANTVTTKTSEIAPGKTEELSLDVKWTNSESNFGERHTQAQITATTNEAKAAETTTEDNQSEADMIIGIVTGEYDNIIKGIIIGIIALAAITGEVIIIKKYIL